MLDSLISVDRISDLVPSTKGNMDKINLKKYEGAIGGLSSGVLIVIFIISMIFIYCKVSKLWYYRIYKQKYSWG